MDSSPLVNAHQFAANAVDYSKNNDLSNACTSHFRAAEQFLLAMNDTNDVEAVKTLKLLYAFHTRSGKEIQRKLLSPPRPNANITTETNNPNPTTKAVHLYSNANQPLTQQGPTESMLADTSLFVGQSQSKGPRKLDLNNLIDSSSSAGIVIPTSTASSTSATSAIGQSYLILEKGLNPNTITDHSQEGEEEDPFNKFWDAVEGLVHKLSNPVAFTSAPISEKDDRNLPKPQPHIVNNTNILNSYLVINPGDSIMENQHPSQHNGGHTSK